MPRCGINETSRQSSIVKRESRVSQRAPSKICPRDMSAISTFYVATPTRRAKQQRIGVREEIMRLLNGGLSNKDNRDAHPAALEAIRL